MMPHERTRTRPALTNLTEFRSDLSPLPAGQATEDTVVLEQVLVEALDLDVAAGADRLRVFDATCVATLGEEHRRVQPATGGEFAPRQRL